MARSFTVKQQRPKAKRRTVLVTGAGGNIGSYFASHSSGRYKLRLMVHKEEEGKKIGRYGEVLVGDLADLEGLKRICRGIDTVVHLAADPSPSADWASLLQNNIVGAYHMYVAAKAAGCRRLIYASSIHAISGYPADVQVKPSDPVNPGDLYGVSKCFAEAMGRYMAEQEGLSVIAIRIGAFQGQQVATSDDSTWMFDAWVSERDLNQLIENCIDDEQIRFAIFHGLSDNRFKRMDISNARELVGYAPKDDLTEAHPQIRKLQLRKKVTAHSMADGQYESGLRKELGKRPRQRR